MEVTIMGATATSEEGNRNFYLGLTLAVASTIFIGSSFIIKKKALIQLNRAGGLRAGSGGFGYLKEWVWWLGLITMGLGEAANFAAYAFAPASLVTPLGALSVLVSAILSSRYLNEKLNLLGKLGCLLCILGTTIIVIHSPKQEEVATLSELVDKLQDSSFVVYVLAVVVVALSISCHFGPKYGHRYVLVYITLCSAVGSLTVMACKALGLAIKEELSTTATYHNKLIMFSFFIVVVSCIFIQMNYLNKSLDLFNTNIVTPVYYVFFTTLVLVASAILFKEWKDLQFQDVLGNICGFLTVIIAIFLLTVFKSIAITDVFSIGRPKSDSYSYESLSSRPKRTTYNTQLTL